MKYNYPIFIACIFTLSILSCNNNKTSNSNSSTSDSTKQDSLLATKQKQAVKPPIINFEDTLTISKNVITISDSAATMEILGEKLTEIYNKKLPEIIAANKLTITGAPMAWYKSNEAPYFFEAGMPVNKKPSKMGKNVGYKDLPATRAIIAHFFGPYEILHTAYESLDTYMKENKKSKSGMSYEIYIGNPVDSLGNAKDPYKVQTDIVFPYK